MGSLFIARYLILHFRQFTPLTGIEELSDSIQQAEVVPLT